MSNLVRFDDKGIELVINTDNGEAFATQAGYARMSGISYPAIKKRVARLKGGDDFLLKTAEIQTPGGKQVVTLLSTKTILQWLVKDNPKLALAMGEAGATMYLHQLAGYKVSSNAIEPTTPLELAQSMLDALKKQEAELAKLNELAAVQKEINQETQERLEGLEAEQERLIYPGGRYYTAMGYANLKGVKLSLSDAIRIGKLASEFCRENQIEINRVADTKFGKINSYPESVLSELILEEVR